MLTLFASFFGLAGSWVPQLFKMWTDKSDKKHEITLLQMQIDAAKEQSLARLDEIGAQGDIAQATAIYQTYKTGINWVDALNGTVRPIVTYSFFFLYAAVKYIQYSLISNHAPSFEYLDIMWTEEDRAIFAGVISFYFGQRSMNKGSSK